jgi:hypothetical protein
MRLLQYVSELFGAWNISPLRQQLAVPRENQDLKLRSLALFDEL